MTTHVNNHPDIETLSAFADAELNEAIVGRVRAHLRDCGDCTRRVEAVRALASAARALPRDIAAPPQAWDALRDRMVRERTTRPAATRWWHNGWMAAAAAIVLVAGTAVLARSWPSSATRERAIESGPTAGTTIVTPAVLAVDGNYARTLADLRATLQAQRSTLAPQTVRVVERSLAVIDSAIVEARAALAADPANGVLVEILAAQYERKVDLLQRATRLSSEL